LGSPSNGRNNRLP